MSHFISAHENELKTTSIPISGFLQVSTNSDFPHVFLWNIAFETHMLFYSVKSV